MSYYNYLLCTSTRYASFTLIAIEPENHVENSYYCTLLGYRSGERSTQAKAPYHAAFIAS